MAQLRHIAPAQVVTVSVPATSANLGPGFDSMGLAVSLYDEVTIETLATTGLEFDVSGEGAETIARDESHLIIQTLAAALADLGYELGGVRLSSHNAIPHGRGLGSSAAAIVAALLIAQALVPEAEAPSRDWVFQRASSIEGHPDNVAPAVFGGCTVSWSEVDVDTNSDDVNFRTAHIAVDSRVTALVAVPETEVATKLARSLLPDAVEHATAAQNSARTALLVHALSSAPELLLAGTEDFLHQRYRESVMPDTIRLINAWRKNGIAAAISGAGPTAIAFVSSAPEASKAEDVAGNFDTSHPWRVLKLGIDLQGATVIGHRKP